MPKPRAKSKKHTPRTLFRVHYRTSAAEGGHSFDCAAVDVGAAHDACRAYVAEHAGKTVRVFIDKTKSYARGDVITR